METSQKYPDIHSLISRRCVNYTKDEKIPKEESSELKRVSLQFNTIGDNLDHDSKLDIYLFLPPDIPNGTIAHTLGWVGGDGAGPRIGLPVVKSITKQTIRGCHLFLEIRPDGHDKWDYQLAVEIEFFDGTKNSWGPVKSRLGNHGGYPHYNLFTNVF